MGKKVHRVPYHLDSKGVRDLPQDELSVILVGIEKSDQVRWGLIRRSRVCNHSGYLHRWRPKAIWSRCAGVYHSAVGWWFPYKHYPLFLPNNSFYSEGSWGDCRRGSDCEKRLSNFRNWQIPEDEKDGAKNWARKTHTEIHELSSEHHSPAGAEHDGLYPSCRALQFHPHQ